MDKSIHTRLYQRVIARLRAKREEKGVTQMQLAEKLGVNQTFVSKVEICERRLDIVELLTICEILEIPFVDFIKEIDEDIISKFKDYLTHWSGRLLLIIVKCVQAIVFQSIKTRTVYSNVVEKEKLIGE